jgi:hypothetical protein
MRWLRKISIGGERSRLPAAAVCALIFAATPLLGGCGGGDDELSLDDYFERVDALDAARAMKLDRLNEELEALDRNDVRGGIGLLEQQTDVREEFTDELDELDPPPDVASLHDETVTSQRASVAAYRDYVEDAQDAQSVIELVTLFKDVDFDAINGAIERCQKLEEFAIAREINVDLECQS